MGWMEAPPLALAVCSWDLTRPAFDFPPHYYGRGIQTTVSVASSWFRDGFAIVPPLLREGCTNPPSGPIVVSAMSKVPSLLRRGDTNADSAELVRSPPLVSPCLPLLREGGTNRRCRYRFGTRPTLLSVGSTNTCSPLAASSRRTCPPLLRRRGTNRRFRRHFGACPPLFRRGYTNTCSPLPESGRRHCPSLLRERHTKPPVRPRYRRTWTRLARTRVVPFVGESLCLPVERPAGLHRPRAPLHL